MSFQELKPASETEWLELRTKVLTATEVSVILGLNKWKSVKQLLESKEKVEILDNSYITIGQWLEPVVVQATNKMMGRNFKLYENGSRSFFADFDLGLGATPDAGDDKALLECKTTKPRNFYMWSHLPPVYYLMQLYTQMYCIGRDVGYLSIMSTDMTQMSPKLDLKLVIFKLKRDKEIDEILLKEIKRFWKTTGEGKSYRVDRKQAAYLELKLLLSIERVNYV